MTRKENKKGNQVVRDMKECFRSFHLPVNQLKAIQDNSMNVAFTSQICNDHVCAGVAVTFDRAEGYVGIDAFFHRKVPSDKMAEISKLLNLLNGVSPIYGYSICQCCNTISLRSSLFLMGEILPKGKFGRLIHEMLEDTYLCSPLIEEVVAGGNPEALYDRFMDDHKDTMGKESTLTEGAKRKILIDMESVMTGLKISIKDDERIANGFVMGCMFEDMDFPLRMGVTLDNETEMVRLILSAPFIVPDVKIPVTTELVNLINRRSAPDHLFINRKTKRVVLHKAIMIDNGVLDKRELEMSIRTLLGNGSLFFPIIKEQLSSNESPEVLLERIRAKYTDSRQESK
jgi:hypothetical protein